MKLKLDKVNADVEFTATLTVNEEELKALDALVGYGGASFIKVFQEHLGKSYLNGSENTLLKIFEEWRQQIPRHLHKIKGMKKHIESYNNK